MRPRHPGAAVSVLLVGALGGWWLGTRAGGERFDVLGVQRLATDAPVAAADLFDRTPVLAAAQLAENIEPERSTMLALARENALDTCRPSTS